MPRYRIDCIRKLGTQYNPHERIEGLGGVIPTAWYDTEANILGFIERRKHSYFVLVGSLEAEVIVACHRGRMYLRTTADGYAPDTLLSLPECP